MSRADIFSGAVAAILGGGMFILLHDCWFSTWLPIFGENASSNSAYEGISHLGQAAPFFAAGVIIGLVAGLGIRAFRMQLPTRLLFGPVLSMVVLLIVQHDVVRYVSIFLPALWISFAIALTISAIEMRLSAK